jgi:hypothetical protein
MSLVPAMLLAALLAQVPAGPQTVPFYISDGTGIAGYDEGDRELARLALEAWSRESGGRVKFTAAVNEGQALLRVRWASPDQGLFGEMQRITVNGRPGAIVFILPGVANMGEAFASRAAKDRLFRDTIVYLTCVHETGHALGLQHTSNFDDIMYYFGNGGDLVAYFLRYRERIQSRAEISKFSGLSANDVAELKKRH